MSKSTSKNGLPVLLADPSKPDLSAENRRKNHRTHWWQSIVVHLIRVGILAAILLLLHFKSQQRQAEEKARESAPKLSLATAQRFVPATVRIGDWSAEQSAKLMGATDQAVGLVIHTRSQSSEVVGYVGPTSLIIYFDAEQKIVGLEIDQTADTVEHVDAIRRSDYLQKWNGKDWEQAAQHQVDSVSGATLTCFAIQESLRRRLGNQKPSTRFPDPVTVEEIQQWLPDAYNLRRRENYPLIVDVLNKQDAKMASYIRTSPVSDSIHGYQGPADVLLLLDGNDRFLELQIRSSFDNQDPETFVDYVREDEYFRIDRFAKLSLDELLAEDPDDIEGVSGATLTSQGIFRAVHHAVEAARKKVEPEAYESVVTWSARDIGTTLILIFAVLFTFSPLRKLKFGRIGFQLVLICYFGFINGDLLSQLLFSGWVENGIGWKNAIGLSLLGVAAVLLPVVTKRNVYCHQICPMGAAQQLVKKLGTGRRKMPRTIHRMLRVIPALLLGIVVLNIVWNWDLNLAALEPFDAFSLRIAGLATICIAVVGLIASFVWPMAYCRYGCPTGGLLEYVRRTARSNRIGLTDGLAILLLLTALALFVF